MDLSHTKLSLTMEVEEEEEDDDEESTGRRTVMETLNIPVDVMTDFYELPVQVS